MGEYVIWALNERDRPAYPTHEVSPSAIAKVSGSLKCLGRLFSVRSKRKRARKNSGERSEGGGGGDRQELGGFDFLPKESGGAETTIRQLPSLLTSQGRVGRSLLFHHRRKRAKGGGEGRLEEGCFDFPPEGGKGRRVALD